MQAAGIVDCAPVNPGAGGEGALGAGTRCDAALQMKGKAQKVLWVQQEEGGRPEWCHWACFPARCWCCNEAVLVQDPMGREPFQAAFVLSFYLL